MDYKARFYSPALGRFHQPDSIIPDQFNPQSWNRYAYAFNNPIRYNDPDGHCPICLAAVLVVAAFVMTGSVQRPEPYGPQLPPPPWGDTKPDATFTSYSISLSKGFGERHFWTGSIDIVSTKKEVGIFASHSTLMPFVCEENACLVGKEKINNFIMPGVSITKTKGLIWGDELAEDILAYEEGSSVSTMGIGEGNLTLSVEGFASTDRNTAKRNDKYIGGGVSVSLGFGPPLAAGDYYMWAKNIWRFRKPWAEAE